jgi:hypothetical protein
LAAPGRGDLAPDPITELTVDLGMVPQEVKRRRGGGRPGQGTGVHWPVLVRWADTHGVRLHFITPSKQNAHIESFLADSATSALNEAWFLTLADARRIIEAWRQDYNRVRPHSALGYLTPDEFERIQRNGAKRTPEKESMDARLAPRVSAMLDATTPTG